MLFCGPTGTIFYVEAYLCFPRLPIYLTWYTRPQQFKKLALQQHFMTNQPTPHPHPHSFLQSLYFVPSSWLEKKKCLNVHFKDFSIIKGSISLRWKLHCWFEHRAASSSPSERSLHDDICSNHWVMSLTNIKSPMSRCKKFSKKQSYRVGKQTSWMGYVPEEKTFDTSFYALPMLKPSGIKQGLCECSLTLRRGQP